MNDYERIEKVIRYAEKHYHEQPSLAELAKVVGLSEFHFHRLFTRWSGTTPKSFLKMLTAQHAKKLLAESRDLLSVSMESGLSGPGRLHDLFVSIEGMTPGEFKSKGEGVTIEYGFHDTRFGKSLIGVTARGVCYLGFITDQKSALTDMTDRWPKARYLLNQKGTRAVVEKLFKPHPKVKLFLGGTAFQIKVWEALLRIPEGNVLSYKDIAKAVGKPNASRAVGTAVGSNPISFLIPCHRVIKDTGVVGEYHWGHERKQALLLWESLRAETKKPSR